MKERNEIEIRAGWIGWFVRLVGFRIGISSWSRRRGDQRAGGCAGARLKKEGKKRENEEEVNKGNGSSPGQRAKSKCRGFEVLWLWDGMGWDEGW